MVQALIRRVDPAKLVQSAQFCRFSSLRTFLASANETVDYGQVDVAIVGGGPSGLFLNLLLRRSGLKTAVLEQRFDTVEHPQAHYINLRSVEIMRHACPELLEQVRHEARPLEEWKNHVWCTSLVDFRKSDVHDVGSANLLNSKPGMRRFLVDEMETPSNILCIADMLNSVPGSFNAVSPTLPMNIPQDRFEKMLFGANRQLDSSQGGTLYFGHRVTDIEHLEAASDADSKSRICLRGNIGHATESPRSAEPGCNFILHCKYLVGADGARSRIRRFAETFEIQKDKNRPAFEEDYQSLLNVHFSAPSVASKIHVPAMLYFVVNPDVIGCLVGHNIGKGEFVLQIPLFEAQMGRYGTRGDAEHLLCKHHDMFAEKVCAAIGYKPADLRLLHANLWRMGSNVAQKYVLNRGRIFLVGDAAHTFPPAGGLGMNTGLQDAFSLAWRLVTAEAICNGIPQDDAFQAATFFLEGYGLERQPVGLAAARLADTNLRLTLGTMRKAFFLDQRLGNMADLILRPMLQHLIGKQALADIFDWIVRMAQWPTALLRRVGNRDSVYRRFAIKQLRAHILEKHAGLPMLMPRHVLGRVDATEAKTSHVTPLASDAVNDWSYFLGHSGEQRFDSKLVVGMRMPHACVRLEKLHSHSLLKESDETEEAEIVVNSGLISTVDLPAQIAQAFADLQMKPVWVVLSFVSNAGDFVDPHLAEIIRWGSWRVMEMIRGTQGKRRTPEDTNDVVSEISSFAQLVVVRVSFSGRNKQLVFPFSSPGQELDTVQSLLVKDVAKMLAPETSSSLIQILDVVDDFGTVEALQKRFCHEHAFEDRGCHAVLLRPDGLVVSKM